MESLPDRNRGIEQLNIIFAIKGEAKTSLAEILPVLTKVRLSSLASINQLPGRAKLKKSELAERLLIHCSDINFIENTLLITGVKEWRLFEELLNCQYRQINNVPPGHYIYLLARGLVFTFYHRDELYFVVPTEVKDALGRIGSTRFQETRSRVQDVCSYIRALANLDGVFEPEKLIEIFNAQNDNQLDEDEFWRIFDCLASRRQYFWLNAGYILSNYFENDENGKLDDILARTKDMPYYIPPREELLKYADRTFYELTPQLAALRDYVLRNMCKDAQMVEYLIDEVQLHCTIGDPMQALLFEFERRNMVFTGKKQLSEVLPLLMDVHNNTRMWANRGHTPNEIQAGSGMAPAEKAYGPLRVIYGGQAHSNQVGRNDLCPCGSGKKYKKCCGR